MESIWLFTKALAALGCAGVAFAVAWKGRGGDFILLAMLGVIASCTIATKG